MRDPLVKQVSAAGRISDRDMVEALRNALEKNYGRILHVAGSEWERRFAGKDPSDACVSVRVSDWEQILSGSARSQPTLASLISQAA